MEEDIKPFRDVLLGLFFVTIGMLLNVRVVLDHLWLVLLLLLLPILFVRVDRCWRAPSARAVAWPCAPAWARRRPASSASCC